MRFTDTPIMSYHSFSSIIAVPMGNVQAGNPISAPKDGFKLGWDAIPEQMLLILDSFNYIDDLLSVVPTFLLIGSGDFLSGFETSHFT